MLKQLLLCLAILCSLATPALAEDDDNESDVMDSVDTLSGNPKLACEAILCLGAVGGMPEECMPSIDKYLSINFPDDPVKTAKERANFLELCPKE